MSRLGLDRLGASVWAPALMVACSASARELPRPDVFLFIVDAPGDPVLACPNGLSQGPPILVELASRGVLIADLTLGGLERRPSLGTLMSGSRAASTMSSPLDLAQALAAEGYRTLAVSQGEVPQALGGFERCVSVGSTSEEVARAVLGGLRDLEHPGPKEPCFLLVHLAPASSGLAGAELGALLEHMASDGLGEGAVHALALASSGSEAAGTAEEAAGPLILWGPGLPVGVRVPRAVEGIDLYPTLLEVARVVPSADLTGRSLMPLIEGEHEAWSSYTFAPAEGSMKVRDLEQGFELIVPMGPATQTKREFELFDTCASSDRHRNLAATRVDQVVKLILAYEAWVAEGRVLPGAGVPPDTRRMLADQLESLGYTSIGVVGPVK
jgi:hypothetical protein